MNNAVFAKTMESVRKLSDIKLFTTERRRNYLVSVPNYHTRNLFTEHLLAIEMKKKPEILGNKPVYLWLSILELSNILLHEFRFNHIRPKYGEKTKLCYMDTYSSLSYIKTDDIYKDIAEDLN